MGLWRWVSQTKEEDEKREGEAGVEFIIKDGNEVAEDGSGHRRGRRSGFADELVEIEMDENDSREETP
jgi:hypothetical protein